jgi:adenine-specific DNA-methyltransferase
MENFNEVLIELLKKDPRFVDNENNILRSKIIDAALNTDKELLSLLLTNKRIKDTFFSEVSEYWIFEANKFIDYIQDKNFLNDSYTKYRNKIGLTIDGKFLNERNEVALSFPFKDCILEGGQTKQENNRKEIFFNEILAQDEIDKLLAKKVLTNFKRYTEKGEEKVENFKRDSDGTIRDNLIIKGNNLMALHTIRDQFKGKIKLIYIDPPYNTGNDEFGYNDSFNHSTWLTFMKNRLEVARELLREDGVILIQCDDREMHYLKVLMDEIFYRDNFVITLPRRTRNSKSDVPYGISQDFDWILVYAKNGDKNNKIFKREIQRKYYKTPDFPDDEWRLNPLTTQKTTKERPNSDFTIVNPKTGQKFYVNKLRSWAVTKDTFPKYYKAKKIVFPGDYDFIKINQPMLRIFKSEEINKKGKNFNKTSVSSSFWEELIEDLFKNTKNQKGTKEMIEIFGSKTFQYPKNELLIYDLIKFITEDKDIVMDFFLGSGTTAAVAHKMNRQYIGIEQLDYGENDSVTRLKKVIKGDQTGISKIVNWKGGGDFIYLELARYNQTFVDLISNAKSTNELLKILKDIEEKAFLKYNVDLKELDSSLEEFKRLTLEQQKETLILILNKNQLYVNLSDIDDLRFNISEEDKKLNKKFYS